MTSSSNGIYFRYDIVDFHKPIANAKDQESCIPEECSSEEQKIPEKND